MKTAILFNLAVLILVSINCQKRTVTEKSFGESDELYADVKLHLENPVKDYTNGRTLKMYDWTNKPFTGVQSHFYKANDELYSQFEYEEGLLMSAKHFDTSGNQRVRVQYEYDEDQRVSTRQYNEADILIVESVSDVMSSDGIGTRKEWHPNGQLKFEMSFTSEPKKPMIYQGLMTLYDEQGNITKQENYKDGVLIES